MQTRLVLAAAALAATLLPRGEPAASPALATLALEPGASGRAVLVNQALAPLGLTQCSPAVQRAQAHGWVAASGRTEGCGEPRLLMPGDSGTLAFPCPAAPGTYRLTLAVRLERPSLEPLTAVTTSLPFTIPADRPGPCAGQAR